MPPTALVCCTATSNPPISCLTTNDFAYLIDFGIARALDETRMTKSGNTIGTFAYIAPERLGTGTEDARADIYSLACVLYECLSGRPPFAGETMAGLVAAHLNTPPPHPQPPNRMCPSKSTRSSPAVWLKIPTTGTRAPSS